MITLGGGGGGDVPHSDQGVLSSDRSLFKALVHVQNKHRRASISITFKSLLKIISLH